MLRILVFACLLFNVSLAFAEEDPWYKTAPGCMMETINALSLSEKAGYNQKEDINNACQIPALVNLNAEIKKFNSSQILNPEKITIQKKWVNSIKNTCKKTNNEALTNCLITADKQILFDLIKLSWPKEISDSNTNISLSSPFEFGDVLITGKLSRQQITKIQQLKQTYDFLDFPNCQDILASDVVNNKRPLIYAKIGMQSGIKQEGRLFATCGTLDILKLYKPAEHDDIKNISLANPDNLSPLLLPTATEEGFVKLESFTKQGLKISDLINQGLVTMDASDKHNVKFVYGTSESSEKMGAYYQEVAKGDFTHHGNNEILAVFSQHVFTGTYGLLGWVILALDPNNHLLTPIYFIKNS